MGNLLQESNRNRVFRLPTLCIIVALLLTQVVNVDLRAFDAIQWVIQTIILVSILGLSSALIGSVRSMRDYLTNGAPS